MIGLGKLGKQTAEQREVHLRQRRERDKDSTSKFR